MTEFQVWLWFVALPGLREALELSSFIFGFLACAAGLTVIFMFMKPSSKEERKRAPKKTAIALIVLTILIPIVRACIPTEKQVAAIILVPAVTQSERIRGIGDKTLDMLNGKLDLWLEEMVGDDRAAKKGEKI